MSNAFDQAHIMHSDWGLYRLSSKYAFKKPNDCRALDLMNAAARAVVEETSDITCAYGYSDEFRYSCGLFRENM